MVFRKDCAELSAIYDYDLARESMKLGAYVALWIEEDVLQLLTSESKKGYEHATVVCFFDAHEIKEPPKIYLSSPLPYPVSIAVSNHSIFYNLHKSDELHVLIFVVDSKNIVPWHSSVELVARPWIEPPYTQYRLYQVLWLLE